MDKERLKELAGVPLNEEVERLQKVPGWDLEIDGDEVILSRDSEIKGHMEIDEWMELMKKFNKIQRGRK